MPQASFSPTSMQPTQVDKHSGTPSHSYNIHTSQTQSNSAIAIAITDHSFWS